MAVSQAHRAGPCRPVRPRVPRALFCGHTRRDEPGGPAFDLDRSPPVPHNFTIMDNPYQQQPQRAFWRSAVADLSAIEMHGVYQPSFAITPDMRIAAAGSCFAQHIAAQFKARGFGFLDTEPAPPMLDADSAKEFGYGLYSARYGNIYSVRQLVQLFDRAASRFAPRDDIWETNGKYYDPFRPTIQPGGFASEAELRLDRDFHLCQVARLLEQTDLFVFTFGLTEAWVNRHDGAVLPTCPGTHAGRYDPETYAFKNFRVSEVLEDAESFIAMARRHNPAMRFLFTVSPVPLTATATDQHVLPATVYSKSVLRAACGELMEAHDFVDYFPSYELVASHPMRGIFFRPNMRNVAAEGVARVMDIFFAAHGAAAPVAPSATEEQASEPATVSGDPACDEEILEFFQK